MLSAMRRQEEFNVALAAGDRGGEDAGDVPAARFDE